MTALRAAAVRREDRLPAEIVVAGERCRLDPAGALVLPEHGTVVVADLHLEKGSAFARRGAMLPPYDTAATLEALARLLSAHSPRRVVALGDSFHDRFGPDRLGAADRAVLAGMLRGRDWTWITGNHDPALPETLGGAVVPEASVGALTLRHHPAAGRQAELAGHLHPVAKVVLHGRGVRARAFLTDGRRCVLPAFGAYAGGLNACDGAFAPLFPDGFTAHAIGRNRVFSVTRAVLCGD